MKVAIKHVSNKPQPDGDNLLENLLIHQTFFCQMLKKSQFAKLSLLPNFPAIWYLSRRIVLKT